MVDLIIHIGETGIRQNVNNLTITELGKILSELGKNYCLIFDTIKDMEPAIGFTMHIIAIERN